MDKETMEKQRQRARSAYVPPLTEVYASEPIVLLVGTETGGDPGGGVFGNYVGGNPGGASFGNILSGNGSAGGGSFGSSFGGGGGSAGAALLSSGAKNSDFSVGFSDVWE